MNQNVEYELQYWKEQLKDIPRIIDRYKHQVAMFDLDQYFLPDHCIVDLGCGPVGGIFSARTYRKMIAVDPLWNEYCNMEPHVHHYAIECHDTAFDTFTLKNKADGIICINALDHSGDIFKAADNIHKQLASGGMFILCVHLRSEQFLNKGHQTPLSLSDIDNAFSSFNVVKKIIVPAYGKHPKTLKAWYRARTT